MCDQRVTAIGPDDQASFLCDNRACRCPAANAGNAPSLREKLSYVAVFEQFGAGFYRCIHEQLVKDTSPRCDGVVVAVQ